MPRRQLPSRHVACARLYIYIRPPLAAALSCATLCCPMVPWRAVPHRAVLCCAGTRWPTAPSRGCSSPQTYWQCSYPACQRCVPRRAMPHRGLRAMLRSLPQKVRPRTPSHFLALSAAQARAVRPNLAGYPSSMLTYPARRPFISYHMHLPPLSLSLTLTLVVLLLWPPLPPPLSLLPLLCCFCRRTRSRSCCLRSSRSGRPPWPSPRTQTQASR